ncbi:MAG: cell division protein SepF [Lachnospiraceae bacterium]|nr:cell division protein SepF [Lachnospiraceae bacterium]
MAEFFKKLLDTLKMSDDDEEDYIGEIDEHKYESKAEKKAVGSERSSSRTSTRASGTPSASIGKTPTRKHTQSNYGTSTYIEEVGNEKKLRVDRPDGSKVVPLQTISSGAEVCIMKPRNIYEAQDICDVLLSDCVAIINLMDNDLAAAQRIMDFISGAVYSINGKLIQISEMIYMSTPDNVDVSGDYNDILMQTGFEIPNMK